MGLAFGNEVKIVADLLKHFFHHIFVDLVEYFRKCDVHADIADRIDFDELVVDEHDLA